MIRRILDIPIVRLALYYIGLTAVAFILSRLFPVFGSALEPVDSVGMGALMNPEIAEGSQGFLKAPNVGLRTFVALVGCLALVLPIAYVYMVTRRETRYDQALVHTLIMLPVAVTGIVIIVQSSLALAFSLAGIVAAVRFRNTLQDTKDAVYVFLAIGIGLAGGVQALHVGLIVSGVFNFVILFMWGFEFGNLYGPREASGTTSAAPKATPTAKTTATYGVIKTPSRKRGSKMFDASSVLGTSGVGKMSDEHESVSLSPVLNPELSKLEFDSRVLALAEDPLVPPIARIRFLSIFSRAIDEFFMVRVGGLKQAVVEGVTKPSIDGQSPVELLQAVHVKLKALVRRQHRCLQDLLEHTLEPAGIRLRRLDDLDDSERDYLRDFFDERVMPLLTPKAMTLSGGHPFPFIEDLLLSIAVVLRDPRTERDHFVHLEISDALPRFVGLEGSSDFVPIEDVIEANIETLYPGRQVVTVHPFRITRSVEIKIDKKASNFLEAMEDELRRKPRGAIARIEVERSMPFPIRDMLLNELRREEEDKGVPLQPSDIHEIDGLVDLGSIDEIASAAGPDLDFPPFTPGNPIPADQSIFDLIQKKDILVHHPYDAFETTTERFIIDAADDPDVIAIKLTLYRPGGPSKLGDALIRAVNAGKKVSVFVEVKARFDEELNILWAKQLERGGIHVVTGLVKYKTNAKVALVVRKQGEHMQRYAHIGTGNYNEKTAREYTDLGLLTADEAICNDINVLFNELTGSSRPPAAEFGPVLVGPTNMLRRFLNLIEREAENAKAGKAAGITAKMNGLADGEIVEALYRASQAGVRIYLIVRGACVARPEQIGLSENIHVMATVGRFLEHARIYRFENDGNPEYYMGSADWRPRNMRRRVEVITPVTDPDAQARLDEIFDAELHDAAAWDLRQDGSYVLRDVENVGAQSRAQLTMLERYAQTTTETSGVIGQG
jgi:polyphosphate kinase